MAMSELVAIRHLNDEQKAVADVIGIENYRALMDVYGGDRIWIPRARSIVPPPEVEDNIRKRRQRGDSLEQIARELELTIAEVRKIK